MLFTHLLLIQVQTSHYGRNKKEVKVTAHAFARDEVLYYSLSIHSCNWSFPAFSSCWGILHCKSHTGIPRLVAHGPVLTYCRSWQPRHASLPSLSWHPNNPSLTSGSCWTRGTIWALKPRGESHVTVTPAAINHESRPGAGGGTVRDAPAARHPPGHPCPQGHREAQLALGLQHGHGNQDHHEDLEDPLFLVHQ